MDGRWWVFYLWRGERHIAASGVSRKDAIGLVAEFRADRWVSWMERL